MLWFPHQEAPSIQHTHTLFSLAKYPSLGFPLAAKHAYMQMNRMTCSNPKMACDTLKNRLLPRLAARAPHCREGRRPQDSPRVICSGQRQPHHRIPLVGPSSLASPPVHRWPKTLASLLLLCITRLNPRPVFSHLHWLTKPAHSPSFGLTPLSPTVPTPRHPTFHLSALTSMLSPPTPMTGTLTPFSCM